MRRIVLLMTSMALTVMLAGGVAQAIINGELDTREEAHPYVGALVSVPTSGQFKGQRIPTCSGTLLSARVFLTAGHCTDTIVEEDLPTYVSLDPTYEPSSSKLMTGTAHTHPKFCLPTKEVVCAPKSPDYPHYDVGVVVLDEPVRMATYGVLPEAGVVDTLDDGQRLTIVGYGVRGGSDPGPGDRYRATVRLLNTNNAALGDLFVKTSGVTIGGGGEGSCNGDSGGPLLLPDQQTIVGVTSFDIPPLCRGPGYYQRVDLPQVLSWVRSFF